MPMITAVMRAFTAVPAHALFGLTMGLLFINYSFIKIKKKTEIKNNSYYKQKSSSPNDCFTDNSAADDIVDND